jgi:hypothetical protein
MWEGRNAYRNLVWKRLTNRLQDLEKDEDNIKQMDRTG